ILVAESGGTPHVAPTDPARLFLFSAIIVCAFKRISPCTARFLGMAFDSCLCSGSDHCAIGSSTVLQIHASGLGNCCDRWMPSGIPHVPQLRVPIADLIKTEDLVAATNR